jgi:hypothetical protein
MKKAIFTLSLLYVIFFLHSGLTAYENINAGTASAQLLKMGSSVRAASLADAFSAVPGTLSAIYYNPAGVYSKNNLEIFGGAAIHVQDTSYYSLGAKTKLKKAGDIAAALTGMFSKQNQVTYNNNSLSEDGSFFSQSFFLLANYSHNIKKVLSLGVNLKLYNDHLYKNNNYFSLALDAGAILNAGKLIPVLNNMYLGVSFLNIGIPISEYGVSYYQPFAFHIGLSYTVKLNKGMLLMPVLDLEKFRDRAFRGNIGIEFSPHKIIAIRAGYKIGEGLYGIKAGIGVEYKKIYLDYGFDYSEPGIKSRFELGFKTFIEEKINYRKKIKTLYVLGNKFFSTDIDKAEVYFKMILKLDPSHKGAKERLDEIRRIKTEERILKVLINAMKEMEF